MSPPSWLAVLLLLALGAAWIVALTTLNGAAQAVLPNWVRGRGLAVYLTVFNGAMAGGSLGWGLVAEALGLRGTLLLAAAGLALAGLLAHRVRLPTGEDDLTPSAHWPEPLLAQAVAHDRGPVLVQVEYRVLPEDRAAFVDLVHRLAGERRRDGAFAWGIAEDTAEPERLTEWFMVESWAEHLRQHRRVTGADADVQRQLAALHRGENPPVVRHLLAVESAQSAARADISS